jgi:flagellar basal body L-ring protein FlgH
MPAVFDQINSKRVSESASAESKSSNSTVKSSQAPFDSNKNGPQSLGIEKAAMSHSSVKYGSSGDLLGSSGNSSPSSPKKFENGFGDAEAKLKTK